MRQIPTAWLPTVPVAAIVTHWTAGGYVCGALERQHYHFIIDGNGEIIRGLHSIADNAAPLSGGSYAAHTRGFNAHQGRAVIGVSVCGMEGALALPFRAGKSPIKPEQMETLADVVSQLCRVYKVPVTPQTVLQHGEVQKNRGIMQLGKWDITRLPYAPQLTKDQVCDEFRAQVSARIETGTVPPRLVLHLDGKAGAVVYGARFINGSWQVDGTALLGILGARTTPGVLPLRTHLTLAGYKVDELMTGAHQFLRDPVAPRSEVYARKGQA